MGITDTGKRNGESIPPRLGRFGIRIWAKETDIRMMYSSIIIRAKGIRIRRTQSLVEQSKESNFSELFPWA